MRPIGVGEVPRRILAKAVLRIVGRDVEEAAGPLQVCAGQDGGCEPAVHAMRRIFHHSDTEGVLLVDATNAFNTINRQAALQNISIICPSIAQILILQNTGQDGNCRKRRNRLNGGHNTGRSIGDGHVCPGSNPSNPPVENKFTGCTQAWFADDATSAASQPCTLLVTYSSVKVLDPRAAPR